MKHFDAFAGIGGFTLSFKNIFRESYENVGFSEINQQAIANYLYNFPNHKNYGNIETIQPRDIGQIDLFTAGFPCQPFSIAGKRRGFEDARGTLFFEIARLCKELQPKYILLENVKGLLNHNGGRTFATIYGTLLDIGYSVEFQMVNTKWFLPQNRERLFIIGHLATEKRNFKSIFPIGKDEQVCNREKKTKAPFATTIKATGNMNSDDTYVCFADFRYDEGFRIRENECPTLQSQITGGFSGKPFVVDFPKEFIQQLPRDKNKGNNFDICPTISSSFFEQNNFVSGIRRLTEIECERLQGFPDNWTQFGIFNEKTKEIARTQRYKLVGNAISVPVVEAIARKMKLNYANRRNK